MKNKSIGKALVQSRKQAQEHATENPSTRPKLCTFLFKRESKCLPSQVPKADTHRSPLKLSRSTRNLVKCGYSSQSQAYVHPADSFNPFDSYAIQNIRTLEAFVNICCCHTRDTGCTGNFRFISPQSNFMYKSFSGTLFSVHTIECSTCGSTFVLESDYFESFTTSWYSEQKHELGVHRNADAVFCHWCCFLYTKELSIFAEPPRCTNNQTYRRGCCSKFVARNRNGEVWKRTAPRCGERKSCCIHKRRNWQYAQ